MTEHIVGVYYCMLDCACACHNGNAWAALACDCRTPQESRTPMATYEEKHFWEVQSELNEAHSKIEFTEYQLDLIRGICERTATEDSGNARAYVIAVLAIKGIVWSQTRS